MKLYLKQKCIFQRWDQDDFVKVTSKCQVLTVKSKKLVFRESTPEIYVITALSTLLILTCILRKPGANADLQRFA